MSRLKMVVFDMDGLLVDTERVYQAGWLYAIEKEGFQVSRDLVSSWAGKGSYETTAAVNKITNDPDHTQKIRKTREAYFYDELAAGKVAVKPFAKEVLQALHGNFIIGLATSTMEKRATDILDTLGLAEYIDFPVFGSDVEKLKPDPDVYLKVLSRAESNASEAIAVEDSLSGVNAAKNAKLKALMVPDSDFSIDKTLIPDNVIKVGEDLRIVTDFVFNNK